MKALTFRLVNDRDINFYLKSKNLRINRKYSTNKKKIKAIDHYNWWFQNNNRKSYIVEKEKKKLMILTEEIYYRPNSKKIIFTGLLSCKEKIDLKDLLKAIRWQNKSILKYKKSINVIMVNKINIFGNLHPKFFKFNYLKKEDKLYRIISNIKNIDEKINVYFKEIT